MSAPLPMLLSAMLQCEMRLRLRRLGTPLAVLVLMALSWLMIPDPASGNTLISVDDARVRYTSACIALGGALMASLMFGLGGFYLVRGRVDEDLRSGTGGLLASTPVGNAAFVLGRWLGGVAYLCAMALVFLATMLVLHMLRGEGPIQLGVYLWTFALVLLPTVFLAAAMALLFDSWAPLMGKGGDVLYFVLWAAQLGAPSALMARAHGISLAALLDFSGIGAAVFRFHKLVPGADVSIGASSFNPLLAPVLLPADFWSAPMVGARVACALLALLPLIPAIALFHRFSPDRVKLAGGRRRWSPAAVLNRLARPLAAGAKPLFALAARSPGLPGRLLAELGLTLAANPLALAALPLLYLFGAGLAPAALGGLLAVAVALWGVLISDISVRDYQAGVDGISASADGATPRYLRQLLASYVLGLLFCAPVLLRWLVHAPLRAAALLSGLLALAAGASLLGRCTRSGRAFLALFLFGLYISIQAGKVPALDVVGFNGVANPLSVATQLVAGLLLCALGVAYQRWRED